MSKLPMMPVFVPDLTSDTKNLNAEQFGCYMRILFFAWQKGGKAIPDDPDGMARVCDVPRAKWLRIRPTLTLFFDQEELSAGRWVQARLQKEWLAAEAKAEKARQNGKKGGRPTGDAETQRVIPGFTGIGESQEPAGPTRYPHRYPHPVSNPDPLPSVTAALAILDPSGRSKRSKGGSGFSDSGKWSAQQSRDDYATQKCFDQLPGEAPARWAIVGAAEDPASPEHERACRLMREAAQRAGVGWVSPERRKGAVA